MKRPFTKADERIMAALDGAPPIVGGSVTYGSRGGTDPLGRVYDRLRKRAYRATAAHAEAYGLADRRAVPEVYGVLVRRQPDLGFDAVACLISEAYVAGVRDALNTIAKEYTVIDG